MFKIAPVGLIVPDKKVPFEVWDQAGDLISRADKAIQWAMGDWLIYGENRYGEDHAQALDETRFAERTLDNIASICRRVAPSRRREDLSFSHHVVVAPLAEKDQTYWLKKAAEQKPKRMSIAEIEKAIAAWKKTQPEKDEKKSPGGSGDMSIEIRVMVPQANKTRAYDYLDEMVKKGIANYYHAI